MSVVQIYLYNIKNNNNNNGVLIRINISKQINRLKIDANVLYSNI